MVVSTMLNAVGLLPSQQLSSISEQGQVKPKEVRQESLHLAVFPGVDHEPLRVGLIRGDAHPSSATWQVSPGKTALGIVCSPETICSDQSAPSRTRTVTW